MANTKKYVSFDKLSLYDEKIKKVITDGDAAALASAKEYAEGLGVNYDAAGAAATVQGKLDEEVARAKAAEEANAAAAKQAQDEVDALELVVKNIQENAYDDTELRGKVTDLENNKADKTQVATDIAEAVKAEEDARKEAVKAEEDARKEAVQGVQDAVDTLSGTHATDKAALEAAIALKADKTQVATDIENAVKAEEEARIEAVAAVQGEVDGIKNDYLKGSDKEELEGKINAKADQTALDEVEAVANAAVKQSDYDVKVKALEDEDARIAGLVAEEAERAAGVEESLQNQINTIMSNPDAEGAINSINEFTQYVTEHGTIADGFRTDIDKNKEDIAAHVALDHDFAGADAALKAELEGKINAKADASVVEELSGTVATKAAQADLEALDDRVEALETASETHALKTEVEAISDAMNEYVEAHTGDYTNAQIDEAIKVVSDNVAALNDTYASDEELAAAIEEVKTDSSNKDAVVLANAQNFANELNAAMDERVAAVEAASATHALAADLTALDGRVTTAEGEIDTLQAEMDAVEALADAADKAAKANAEALALKASQADLEAAVARISQNETDIEVLEGVVATKADTTALTAATDRITTLENWHSNFVEVSEEEINSLFQ